jgi:hypothetical protein
LKKREIGFSFQKVGLRSGKILFCSLLAMGLTLLLENVWLGDAVHSRNFLQQLVQFSGLSLCFLLLLAMAAWMVQAEDLLFLIRLKQEKKAPTA